MELYLFNELNEMKSLLKNIFSYNLPYVMEHYVLFLVNILKHNLLKDDRDIIPQKWSKSPMRKVE